MDLPVNTQVVISPTRKTTFTDLPPEILRMIGVYFTQRDRTEGIRVSRDWYKWLIDDLWHTVEITAAVGFHHLPTNYFRFKAAFGENKDNENDGSKEESRIQPSLHQHLGRIRVLEVQHANTLALLSRAIDDHDKEEEEATNHQRPFHSLQDLSASFDQEPTAPLCFQIPPGFRLQPQSQPNSQISSLQLRQPVDLKPFLHIISQCHELRRCSITIFLQGMRWLPGDQAQLLASIPQSVEKFELDSFGTPHIRHHRPERAEAETAVILAQISGTPLLAPHPGLLLSLKTLSLTGLVMDMDVFLVFLERCPNVEELQLIGQAREASLVRILTEGPKNDKGWRTIGFRSASSEDVTRDVVKALLDHCAARLENLRIYGCGETFRSEDIQRLLCSAPRLRRFDMMGEIHDYAIDRHCLLATDVVQSSQAGENWECLDLESFKCLIGGISRPDLQLSMDALDSTGNPQDLGLQKLREQSQNVQRKVLAQFRRLQKLEVISLGPSLELITQDCFNDCCNTPNAQEYFERQDPALQYECLSLTLEDGLGLLKTLKNLKRLVIDKVSHRMGDKEHEWIRRHWPNYGREYRDTFWTDRGHHASCPEAIERRGLRDGNLRLFDWW